MNPSLPGAMHAQVTLLVPCLSMFRCKARDWPLLAIRLQHAGAEERSAALWLQVVAVISSFVQAHTSHVHRFLVLKVGTFKHHHGHVSINVLHA